MRADVAACILIYYENACSSAVLAELKNSRNVLAGCKNSLNSQL